MMTPPDQGGEDFHLSDLSPSDKPWDTHRACADKVQSLYDKSEFADYSRRISKCAQTLQFAFKAKDDGELALKLQQAFFCRCRWCPVCQWRRELMWRARFLQAIPKVLEEYPTAKFVFLTLTVKNCPLEELRDTLTKMNKAWERLTKRKQFPAIGWVKAVEVTTVWDCHDQGKYIGRHGRKWIAQWEKDNKRKLTLELTSDAHPHFHCLLMVTSNYFGGTGYINQAKWTELWKSCLRIDYTPIVNVKSVKPKKGADLTTAMPAAICETLKYSVKEGDLVADQDWLHELTRQLHKTRAIAVGGVLSNYISDKEPEELIKSELDEENPTDETDPQLTFGWREMIQRYSKT